MASLNEIKDKLAQTGQDAVKKAKEFADITRLNALVMAEQKIKKNIYTEIGEAYYADTIENCNEKYKDLFDSVAASDAKIRELKAEIHKIKKLKVCPVCKAECPINSSFCFRCGETLPLDDVDSSDETEFDETIKYCGNCGSALSENADNCTNCGQKL